MGQKPEGGLPFFFSIIFPFFTPPPLHGTAINFTRKREDFFCSFRPKLKNIVEKTKNKKRTTGAPSVETKEKLGNRLRCFWRFPFD